MEKKRNFEGKVSQEGLEREFMSRIASKTQVISV